MSTKKASPSPTQTHPPENQTTTLANAASNNPADSKKTLNHKTHQNQLEAPILAAMIYQILTLKMHQILKQQNTAQGSRKEISYEKLCDALATHLTSLTRSNKSEPFIPDKRHLYHDTRKRQTLYTIGIQALT